MESISIESNTQFRGRPRLQIEADQLQFFIDCCFRVKDIADMYHCSKRTIERRMQEYSIRASNSSTISDGELDNQISTLLAVHRRIGEKSIIGHLRSSHIYVQRHRIRESIQRVDPIGIQIRHRTTLQRRQYCVRSPNSLWHIDGYHKLVCWNIVIHGAIDGFSRLITYLRVSPNNSCT